MKDQKSTRNPITAQTRCYRRWWHLTVGWLAVWLLACGGDPTELRSVAPHGGATVTVRAEQPVAFDPWRVTTSATAGEHTRSVTFAVYANAVDERTVAFDWAADGRAVAVTFRQTDGTTRRLGVRFEAAGVLFSQ